MQKLTVRTTASTNAQPMGNGKPSIPLTGGRVPMVERKISDPSSSSPRGERYPIPSFFEYRIKPKEFDPL